MFDTESGEKIFHRNFRAFNSAYSSKNLVNFYDGSAAINHDGTIVKVSGGNRHLGPRLSNVRGYLLDVDENEVIRTDLGGTGFQFSPNGKWMCCDAVNAVLWDVEDSTRIIPKYASKYSGRTPAFSPVSTMWANARRKKNKAGGTLVLEVVDLKKLKEATANFPFVNELVKYRMDIPERHAQQCSFSPNSKHILVACNRKSVYVFPLQVDQRAPVASQIIKLGDRCNLVDARFVGDHAKSKVLTFHTEYLDEKSDKSQYSTPKINAADSVALLWEVDKQNAKPFELARLKDSDAIAVSVNSLGTRAILTTLTKSEKIQESFPWFLLDLEKNAIVKKFDSSLWKHDLLQPIFSNAGTRILANIGQQTWLLDAADGTRLKEFKIPKDSATGKVKKTEAKQRLQEP